MTAESQSDHPSPSTVKRSEHLCSPNEARLLARHLTTDSVIRWGIITVVALGIIGIGVLGAPGGLQTPSYILLVLAGWFGCTWMGVQVSRQMARLPQLDGDPDAFEATLAWCIRRKPLTRSLRLKVYERLATLRYRQQRYDEAAALSQALLMQIPVPAGSSPSAAHEEALTTTGVAPFQEIRLRLLLMLTESLLHLRVEWGAYASLMELHRYSLNLTELMQLIVLQTRYEIQVGHTAIALWHIDRKIQLAELMPPRQCSVLHAMLVVAAQREGQTRLMHWLQRRVHLLSTSPKQDVRSLIG